MYFKENQLAQYFLIKKYKMHWWTFMITSSQNNVKVDPFFGWQRKPWFLYIFVYCFLVLYSGIYFIIILLKRHKKGLGLTIVSKWKKKPADGGKIPELYSVWGRRLLGILYILV